MSQPQLAGPDARPTPEAEAAPAMDVLGILRRRKLLVVCGLLLGAGLGYLYFAQATPFFQARAQVLVIQKSAHLSMEGQDRVAYNEEVALATLLNTHAQLIRSPKLVDAAVTNGKLGALPSFRGADNLVGAIIANLRVSRVAGERGVEPSSSILELTYRGTDPADCQAVLKAVVQSYDSFLKRTYDDTTDTLRKLLSDAQQNVEAQLVKLETERLEIVKGAKDDAFGGTQNSANILDARVASYDAEMRTLEVNKQRIEARKDSIQRELKAGTPRDALVQMVLRAPLHRDGSPVLNVADRDGRQSLEQELFPLMLEKEKLRLQGLGKDHPLVKGIQQVIDAKRELHGRSAPEKSPPGSSDAANDLLAVYLASLDYQLKDFDAQIAHFRTQFELWRGKANGAQQQLAKEEILRNQIARRSQDRDTLMQKLQTQNIVSNYGGLKAEVILEPTYGGQVEPNFSRIMALAVIMGLGFSLVFAWLLDAADMSFRSAEEIQAGLGLPVLGHIPVLTPPHPDQVAKDRLPNGCLPPAPMLSSYHRPRSRDAESYRAIRTALYFGTHSENHKVIQITSPHAGDGKSTLCANLAVSIAQSGKRVLLVDADFRRPRIHRMFRVEPTAGMSGVILGEVDLPEVIQPTAVDGLWVMTCGNPPDNPAELLTSRRFADLLQYLREHYDFVLVDTPPLLAVTDPCAVAPRADAVLLTMRIAKGVKPSSRRSAEMLKSLGANVLGIVVNGVGRAAGYGYGGKHFYYDGYRFGYGSRYYQYGSEYYAGGSGYGGDYGYEDDIVTTPVINGVATRHGRPPSESTATANGNPIKAPSLSDFSMLKRQWREGDTATGDRS